MTTPASHGQLALLEELVSARSGIIRQVRPFPRNPVEPQPPFLYQATLANFDFRVAPALDRSAGGKGATVVEAKLSAMGEALERYCSWQWDPAALMSAPYSEVAGSALSPLKFGLYADEQYARPGFPFQRFDERQPMHWASAINAASGAVTWVPACEVYLGFPSFRYGENFSGLTSNGLAAGSDLPSAILGGLYECVERDAFILTWMNRLPVEEVEFTSDTLADSVQKHYRRSGIELHAFWLTTDIPIPVMMAVAVDRTGRGPAATVGLGCHLRAEIALRKAILELCQVHASQSARFPLPPPATLNAGWEQVRTLEDHGDYFSIPSRLFEFDFLFGAPRAPGLPRENSDRVTAVTADLAHCTHLVESTGAKVVYVELTTIDLQDYPIRVVRTLTPGLQPIHFGFGMERLGGRRLYEIAAKLGCDSRIRTAQDLNFCPHPLP